MVVEDGETIAGALEKVVKDPSLKETYFTTPLALHAAEQPSKYRQGGGKLKGGVPPPPAPYKGTGIKPQGPKGRGKGGKRFANHKLVAMTPDGKQICLQCARLQRQGLCPRTLLPRGRLLWRAPCSSARRCSSCVAARRLTARGPGRRNFSGQAPFTVVYAFAGPARYCDIRSCLEKLVPRC